VKVGYAGKHKVTQVAVIMLINHAQGQGAEVWTSEKKLLQGE
jgi:hypothetical protein